jgi:hypothetical protein
VLAAELRRSGIGAALRLAVPPSEASQMLAVVERTANSLIWAITMIATLAIAVAWHLSATVMIVTIEVELAGLITILLATRSRPEHLVGGPRQRSSSPRGDDLFLALYGSVPEPMYPASKVAGDRSSWSRMRGRSAGWCAARRGPWRPGDRAGWPRRPNRLLVRSAARG